MQELDMINEIRNCDDPSTLLLWAFDDRVSDDEEETIKYRRRKRFEALRKLLIMLDLSEAKDDSDPEIDHKTALEELTSFLYERIIYRDKLKRLHLDANCDRNGNAIDAKFVDAIDGNATGDRRTRKLLARKMHQTLNGKDVYVITDDRIKGSGDLVVKAYDANDYIANRDVDRNGQLFVFGSRKEWEHCFDQFIPELIDDIATNTQKKADKSSQTPGEELPELKALRASQLVRVRELKEDGSLGEIYGMFLSITPIEGGEIQCKNPKAFFSNIAVKAGKPAYSKEYEQYKDSILRTIVIYDEKDNLEGQNEFRASRKAGSSKLAVLKFKIEIRGSDTKKEVRHYEFQIYLPKGFANSKFSLRDSWESYSIKRANKVGRAFWPEDIYEVDHAQAQSDAFSGLEQELGFKLEQEDCNDELACQSIGGNSVDLYAAQ